MTIAEFLDALVEAQPDGWILDSGELRCAAIAAEHDCIYTYACCPIVTLGLCREPERHALDLDEAGEMLGLSEDDIELIATAADHAATATAELRREMIKRLAPAVIR